MSKEKCARHNCPLWLMFTVVVFVTLHLTFAMIAASIYLMLSHSNMIPENFAVKSGLAPIILMLCLSLAIGTLISLLVGRVILKPLTEMCGAFDRVAGGDFSVRLKNRSRVREISAMTGSFNTMAKELSGIETLRSDFVVSVSHEFKTPIAAIEGYATLLQDEALDDERRAEYLGRILENSRRLSQMSGNILTLSKLENQGVMTENAVFRLDEQIRVTILALESLWGAKNVEFDLELPKREFCGCESLLPQVWYNLIGNAIKFSSDGGQVGVRLEDVVGGLRVAVSDSGSGMSEETQKHIFEKFYQGDPSRQTKGNGLGLALVKRIVELCGGSVAVVSEPGIGSTFTVELPECARAGTTGRDMIPPKR